ncbi:TetR/AcrR family transcriptional regulator [Tengunoibacter tsumagoiensis]|uniref:TetR family transcriptional regulator n=1 Tax=Tengunoibacter tsumagoiensis TaxID=2014871 RepID=A0A402A9Y6_9CHLR|nr:TetR/AcrR family transcriptional regulator [Tengunoibacter tsumagoiensis]GCE15765.1 TetR family transcriptional regulator [Tengunoibacter tsumagoiensis]
MPKIVDEQMREATRRHIIHQAASEFARLGFDQANINTIAEQAGIGKGTIYLYFENKRELFLAMLRLIAQEHIAAIRTALAQDGTIEQRLEWLFGAFARLAQQERDSFNVYMSALYGVNRSFQAEATRLLRDYVTTIALLLEQSQARGEIECSDVEATALMILSLTESYILSAIVLGQSEQKILSQANLISKLVLKGLLPSS